jgi:glycosyltransferase involved in cell wall biosynthesis
MNQFLNQGNLLVNLSFLFDKPTGLSVYAKNLFPYLKTLDPTLLTATKIPDFSCYQIPNNLTPAQGSKGHFNRLLWTQFQLPKIYQKLQSSLLFSPIPEAPLYNKKCNFVVTVHDLIPLRFPKRFSPLIPYFKYYIPQVLQQAKHIICDSQATADDMVNFYKIPAHKITIILLAFDQNNFQPINLNDRQLNKVYKPYFIYIGRPDPHKNLTRIIKAFAQLKNNQDLELWLVGAEDPRYTPKLQELAQELNIKQQIKFLDYVSYEQLPVIINQALALVFPSLWEGFGLPVLEAMACGTPVITSKISSLPEVAGDGAILIDPYNIQELNSAMESLVNDQNLRIQLKEAGLKRASQFSWEKTGNHTVEILQQFL